MSIGLIIMAIIYTIIIYTFNIDFWSFSAFVIAMVASAIGLFVDYLINKNDGD